MTIFQSANPLIWGELDLPLAGIPRDWAGQQIAPAPMYALAADATRLWFVASHARPAALHPQARPGAFQAELWKYDVAELFLADPRSGRYIEFNLSPNGAWWSCELTAPRVRAEDMDIAMPDVATFADLAPDGAWLAAAALPLDVLRARINFGPETCGNVTFILGTPAQKFLTASALGDGEPDYHRPGEFPQLSFTELPPS